MIIIKLYGGMGNQMFQYALGRSLSYKYNQELKFDLSFFENPGSYISRKCFLENFNTVGVVATKDDLNNIKINKIKSIWQRISLPYYKRTVVREPFYHFAPEVLNIQNSVLLDGYWQSEKYFKDYEDIIRNDFKMRSKNSPMFCKMVDLISVDDSISIHFRRADYLKHEISETIGVQPLEYYYKAISFIKTKVNNPHIFIFSDDIDWVRNNLKCDLNVSYVSNNELKDYEELLLMSKCQHNIIANSSFSWWGAWLNKNEDKIVVAPKKWFNNSVINTKDLIPIDWITI